MAQMKRPPHSVLREKLMETEFSFIADGELELQEIYRLVRRQYPNLCDDSIICRDICGETGNDAPEWEHQVRNALSALKKKDKSRIGAGHARKYWRFGGDLRKGSEISKSLQPRKPVHFRAIHVAEEHRWRTAEHSTLAKAIDGHNGARRLLAGRADRDRFGPAKHVIVWENGAAFGRLLSKDSKNPNGPLREVDIPMSDIELFDANKSVEDDRIEEYFALQTATAELTKDGAFDPTSIVDARERVMASIVRRRGQPEFRMRLLAAFNGRCAISGCDVESVLEAAHVHPYRGPETNHISNGLLLRADLHTLFDLRMIAVDGATMTVRISPALDGTCYEEFRGKQITLPRNVLNQPSQQALNQHRAKSGL